MKDTMLKLLDEIGDKFEQLTMLVESENNLNESDWKKIDKQSEDMFNTLMFLRQIISVSRLI